MSGHICKQEARLTLLEQQVAVANNDIRHLVEKLKGLTNILTTLSFLIAGSLMTALGYLITYWVRQGG
jgi:hypothetical protein